MRWTDLATFSVSTDAIPIKPAWRQRQTPCGVYEAFAFVLVWMLPARSGFGGILAVGVPRGGDQVGVAVERWIAGSLDRFTQVGERVDDRKLAAGYQ